MANDKKNDNENKEFDLTNSNSLSVTPKPLTITVSGDKSFVPENNENPRVQTVPVISLNSVVVFPFALTPLVINGENAIKIMETSALDEQRLIGLFPELDMDGLSSLKSQAGVELPIELKSIDEKSVSSVGVLARIVKMMKFPDGAVRVLVRGLSRVRYLENVTGSQYPTAKVERVITPLDSSTETIAIVRNSIKQFQEIASFLPNFPEELKVAVMNLNDNARIVDLIADAINLSYDEKLAILALPELQQRLHLLAIFMNREVEVLRLGSEIQSQVHNAMTKSQREFFLREQLRAIKDELGEGNKNPDVISIYERLAKLNLPPNVGELVKKEAERLDMIPQASGEYNIAYNYIDWLLSIPWNNYTEDRIDVKKAAELLDTDHYGLKDVKERILEYLSVLQINDSRKAPIICFVGPPGVGKTSLGKSIADAMGRSFVRVSLGGIRDEAEIRGHRRTYIGALPGRIIQGMKKAGTSNPVFMLDELDKLGNDFRGDPAAALLEVLDPQQNNTFNDHYIELDYDLSSVMFIATANVQDTIPGPLLDRMEIIRLPGYTALEKLQIAKRYLVPRQLTENGLENSKITFNDSAIEEIVNHYTLEAGVRGLERTIAMVCRKIARKVVEGAINPKRAKTINGKLVRELLGPRKFILDEAENKPQIGVATGMAWTSVGGTILPVEVTRMPGKGELKLTGSLGDVMKESAMAAFSYVRSKQDVLEIDPEAFTEYDIHIHVPDGATPKDGPSAGVTIITALVSLLTGKPVRPKLAMTGEITLRGKVTAIGGVKEKVIGALRAGIEDVIIPLENEKDLADIPDEVKSKIKFHPLKDIKQVLDIALNDTFPKKKIAKIKTKKTVKSVSKRK